MKVLFDECVPRRLRRSLPGHEISTAVEMGWSGIKNGALLTLAEKQFDVFVTVDRNLSFQQNVQRFNIAVLVLHSKSNKLASLMPLIPWILNALPSAMKGDVTHIGAE